jgi:hypothetical protein
VMGRALVGGVGCGQGSSIRGLAVLGLLALSACSVAQRQPPGVPPSPASITKDEPGGDADNPEVAALDRLLTQSWGQRADKRGAVMLGLPDSANWRRVTFWLIDTFTGFRYGDDHHAVAALFVRDAPSPGADSQACLREFEAWAESQASAFRAEVSVGSLDTTHWRESVIAIRRREGAVAWGLETRRYAAVYASYPFWDGSCATLAYAFPMKEDPDLAIRVRDRFAAQAFPRIIARGRNRPP